MREIPDYFYEWTELDLPGTGKRLMKPDTLEDIRQKLIAEEKRFFKSTHGVVLLTLTLKKTTMKNGTKRLYRTGKKKCLSLCVHVI